MEVDHGAYQLISPGRIESCLWGCLKGLIVENFYGGGLVRPTRSLLASEIGQRLGMARHPEQERYNQYSN